MQITPITPYPLPESFLTQVVSLAGSVDVLILGELHGTQEVPRLLLSLLEPLSTIGYGGLGLEIPSDQQSDLVDWATGRIELPPTRFRATEGFRDGVGNVQLLSLLRQSFSRTNPWQVLCFDQATEESYRSWTHRDARMAENLRMQWREYCPERKVLVVCGNVHSRIVPPTATDILPDCWPSFAFNLQQGIPIVKAATVDVIFYSGAFFNGEVKEIHPRTPPLASAAEWQEGGRLGHTGEWHFPRATPATFWT
jgi:hypothetical protein